MLDALVDPDAVSFVGVAMNAASTDCTHGVFNRVFVRYRTDPSEAEDVPYEGKPQRLRAELERQIAAGWKDDPPTPRLRDVMWECWTYLKPYRGLPKRLYYERMVKGKLKLHEESSSSDDPTAKELYFLGRDGYGWQTPHEVKSKLFRDKVLDGGVFYSEPPARMSDAHGTKWIGQSALMLRLREDGSAQVWEDVKVKVAYEEENEEETLLYEVPPEELWIGGLRICRVGSRACGRVFMGLFVRARAGPGQSGRPLFWRARSRLYRSRFLQVNNTKYYKK